MWFAVQTTGQEHGPDPRSKVLLAAWLETELWVNPWLLGAGLAGLIAAVLLFAIPRRRALPRT